MIQLIVNGITYLYPSQGDSPPWGSEATDWAQAVTNALTATASPGDILPSSTTIANNVVSPTNVTGLAFDPTAIRGAIVEYSVYRVTTGIGALEQVETGTMYLSYLSTANAWNIVVVGGAFAGMTFSITTLGQVQYLSSNFTGSGYSGVMKFRARTMPQ